MDRWRTYIYALDSINVPLYSQSSIKKKKKKKISRSKELWATNRLTNTLPLLCITIIVQTSADCIITSDIWLWYRYRDSRSLRLKKKKKKKIQRIYSVTVTDDLVSKIRIIAYLWIMIMSRSRVEGMFDARCIHMYSEQKQALSVIHNLKSHLGWSSALQNRRFFGFFECDWSLNGRSEEQWYNFWRDCSLGRNAAIALELRLYTYRETCKFMIKI